MTYREQFAQREALRASLPKREYISDEEWRKQKAALTRAINSGDPRKVLAACEKVVADWNTKVWPDDWARWRRALEDAASAAKYKHDDWELGEELQAASYVLFP
jgi:hypothetical protein